MDKKRKIITIVFVTILIVCLFILVGLGIFELVTLRSIENEDNRLSDEIQVSNSLIEEDRSYIRDLQKEIEEIEEKIKEAEGD